MILIVGCGAVGERVAASLLRVGDKVQALVRKPARAEALRERGVDAFAIDLDDPAPDLSALKRPQVIFHFAPPPPRGHEDSRSRALLAAMPEKWRPQRLVLVSTTGVYGDCAGEWVDEARPPQPQADRARRRLDAETVWREWSESRGVPLAILRVAGIYGPDKLPVTRLRSAEPVLLESESPWSNRIHIDDLVSACLAAGESGEGIYNACDDQPSNMTDYFNRVADALGLPRPPQISLEQAREQLSAGMLSYLAESKRLSNRRLREELGVVLRYPGLREGLADVADSR